MTDPVPTPAGWLLPEDVKAWLRLGDAADDALLEDVIGAVEVVVARDRFDALPDPSADLEVYQGAVMYAARVYRRRNSPAGVESFGESVSYVARWDPDVDRFLRRGAYRFPGVG